MGRGLTRGEVRWFRFPKPDKRRPVLVLSRGSALAILSDVTVAPITTRVRGIPSEVYLDAEDGMPRACAVNCDHIKTVPRARLGGRLTTLTDEKLEEVRKAVMFALALDDAH